VRKNCNLSGSSVFCDNGLSGVRFGNTTFCVKAHILHSVRGCDVQKRWNQRNSFRKQHVLQ
jgi:hypothetical protein